MTLRTAVKRFDTFYDLDRYMAGTGADSVKVVAGTWTSGETLNLTAAEIKAVATHIGHYSKINDAIITEIWRDESNVLCVRYDQEWWHYKMDGDKPEWW